MHGASLTKGGKGRLEREKNIMHFKMGMHFKTDMFILGSGPGKCRPTNKQTNLTVGSCYGPKQLQAGQGAGRPHTE